MSLDLEKRTKLVLDLKKDKGLEGVVAQVAVVLDYSGSAKPFYTSGYMQKVVERLLAIGLAFDDNKQIDAYIFHNSMHRVDTPVTEENYNGFVNDHIFKRYSFGGTEYAPVVNRIIDDYTPRTSIIGSFLNSFFGSKPKESKIPTYCIVITDGDNDDKPRTEDAIRKSSEMPIFFHWIGIGREEFKFLNKLDNLSGRKVDNCAFTKYADMTSVSDDELYGELMRELPVWYNEAKRLTIL